MALKLSKTDATRRADYVQQLHDKWLAVQTAVEVFNERTAALHEDVDKAVEEYNELLSEVRGFAEYIAIAADDEIGNKSDKWAESERGEAATSWRDQWEGYSPDEIEVTYPDDLMIEDPQHADDLEALPEQPE
jgi:hypothetical protein